MGSPCHGLDTATAIKKILTLIADSLPFRPFPLLLPELADICHEYGVPLLVDEAHGSHFGTHPLLPPSAMSQGADSSMHSTHKVLSAMTQAAMLHVRGPLMDPLRVSRSLQVLQVRGAAWSQP